MGRTLGRAVFVATATLLCGTSVAVGAERGALLRHAAELRFGLAVDRTRVNPYDLIVATVSLENTSSVDLSACLGGRTLYELDGGRRTERRAVLNDSAGCEVPVEIAATTTGTFTLRIAIADVGIGDAFLKIVLELRDATTCDERGCSAVIVPTPEVRLTLWKSGLPPRKHPVPDTSRVAGARRRASYGQVVVTRAVPLLCTPIGPGPQGFRARDRYQKAARSAGIDVSTSAGAERS